MKSRFTRKKQAISHFARKQITIHESRSNHENILCHPQVSVTFMIECVHCHAKKKSNQKPCSGESQEIEILYMINKEGSSPSLRCVRCAKVEIFVEMFRANYRT